MTSSPAYIQLSVAVGIIYGRQPWSSDGLERIGLPFSRGVMARRLGQRLSCQTVVHQVDLPLGSRACGAAGGKADASVGSDGPLVWRYLSGLI